MRSTSLFSLFGIALCMSAAVVACSGDDDSTTPAGKTGGIGESCTRSADCSGTNVCVDNICQKKGTKPSGNAGETGTGGSSGGTSGKGGTGGTLPGAGSGGKAGSGGTGVTPPVLGGEGESCTRRADCETGLGCFNQRCAPDNTTGAGGQAGGGGTVTPPKAQLGQDGETCVLPSDCSTGLTCLPGVNTGNLGVCAHASVGIKPTGMSCNAECKVDLDCCQLPLSITEATNPNPFRSCADLNDIIGDTDCADPGGLAFECFIRNTYCSCKPTTWKCSTEGQCQYNVDCTDDGPTTGGCPTVTRAETPLVSTCNVDGKCASVPPDPTCKADADCETKAVTNDPTGVGDTCSPGECTCYKVTGLCYRKCTNDLDCAANQVCNTKAHVCSDAPECTTDANCQVAGATVNKVCVDGSCKASCNNDLDCNDGSLTTFTSVCDTDHTCKSIGCTQDADCRAPAGTGLAGVQKYCTPDPAPGAGTAVYSAVTDGKQ
jgi:hypothetical protein